MLKLIPLTTILFVITACSGNDKSTWPLPPQQEVVNPVQARVNTPAATINPSLISDDFVLSKTYYGKDLVLNFPDSENLGFWQIKGKEAEALFKSLRIKPSTGLETDEFLPSENKFARHISCFKQFKRINPEVEIFSCNIKINYLTGSVNEQVLLTDLQIDQYSNLVLEDSRETNLMIDSTNEIAEITLRGDDAKVLFLTLELDVVERQINDEEVKTKLNMFECSSLKNDKKDFWCKIKINPTTGELEIAQ